MNPEQEDLRRPGLVERVVVAGLAAVEVEDPGLVPVVTEVARSRG
jgi:hypothetical protein